MHRSQMIGRGKNGIATIEAAASTKQSGVSNVNLGATNSALIGASGL